MSILINTGGPTFFRKEGIAGQYLTVMERCLSGSMMSCEVKM